MMIYCFPGGSRNNWAIGFNWSSRARDTWSQGEGSRNNTTSTDKQQLALVYDLLYLFCQGEPGPQGPAGALGEPGIGLTGPKVSLRPRSGVNRAPDSLTVDSKCCVVVCRVTEEHQDLLVPLD